MRTRSAAVAATALTLLVAGCNNDQFLKENPYDFVTPTNFYRTEGDAIAAINGVYATFINSTGDNYYGRNLVMLVEYPTEMVTSRLSATNERSQPDNYTIPTTHSYVQSVWFSAFQAINRANAVIQRVPGIQMDTALRSRIVAEGKFLRALHYFNLVRLFGGVPIRTTETATLDSLQIPRSPASAVYDLIIQDLTDAIAVLPPASAYSGTDVGRASKGAAQTLLAKAYLQRGGTGVGTAADFQSALDLARQVVSSGEYALVPDYNTLFDFLTGTVQEYNSEVIFDIQNIRAPGLGGRISSHMAARNSDLGSSNNGSIEAEQSFFDSYLPGDTRKAGTWVLSYVKEGDTVSYTDTKPYGSQTPFPKKFLDPLMTGTGTEEPNYIILRYAEVLLMVAEAANEVNGGPTSEAYNAINQVRARAGIPNLTPGLSQELFRDSVFVERRWELALEGPNGYFDNQRNWDWATARIEANLALADHNSSKYPKYNPGPIPESYKLMPIPQRAIDINPLLEQNPGW